MKQLSMFSANRSLFKVLRVLIACEESQTICKEFRLLGHEAYSCDYLPCSGGHPEWHLQCDMFDMVGRGWDLIISHPECTYLTVARNKYYKPEYAERFPDNEKNREEAVKFFMRCVNVPAKYTAIENPVGIMSTRYRKPNQVVQPFWFGDTERKSTCLWLKNLPNLLPTKMVKPEIIYHASGRTDSALHYNTIKLKKEERRKARSVTFKGFAKAMATQWSEHIINQPDLP